MADYTGHRIASGKTMLIIKISIFYSVLDVLRIMCTGVTIIFFGLGKHFCKIPGNFGCGEVPDLLLGITFIGVNSRQNLSPAISF